MTIPCQWHRLGNSDVKINLGRLREIPVAESVSIGSLSGRWVGPINTHP